VSRKLNLSKKRKRAVFLLASSVVALRRFRPMWAVSVASLTPSFTKDPVSLSKIAQSLLALVKLVVWSVASVLSLLACLQAEVSRLRVLRKSLLWLGHYRVRAGHREVLRLPLLASRLM
jgi:hypothetical protein